MPATGTVLFDATAIAARVHALGRELRARWPGEPVTLLGILRGAALFTADLVRAVGDPADFCFVEARSYGAARTSSGTVRLGGLVDGEIAGKRVVVTDTILDTGRTLQAVLAAAAARGPAELASCVLLDKPARREVPVRADYTGFEIDDVFVVGYGLDDAGRHRALPEIRIL